VCIKLVTRKKSCIYSIYKNSVYLCSLSNVELEYNFIYPLCQT